MLEKTNCLTTSMNFYQYIGDIEMETKPIQLGHISNTNSQANRVFGTGKICMFTKPKWWWWCENRAIPHRFTRWTVSYPQIIPY